MAGGVIIPYATKIFNQILKNKTIPDIFKTGILTPVLKKALCATKKVNILTLVLSEKNILNETKKHNPPLQVKWAVPYTETKDRATRTLGIRIFF
jgi:hypothetical protein